MLGWQRNLVAESIESNPGPIAWEEFERDVLGKPSLKVDKAKLENLQAEIIKAGVEEPVVVEDVKNFLAAADNAKLTQLSISTKVRDMLVDIANKLLPTQGT
jgi:hypothetical protein